MLFLCSTVTALSFRTREERSRCCGRKDLVANLSNEAEIEMLHVCFGAVCPAIFVYVKERAYIREFVLLIASV